MSFSHNVDYLMAHDGTVAVLVTSTTDAALAFRGHIAWRKGLGGAIDLLLASGEDTITAVVGEHSILAEDIDGEQVAVVFPTGHPASKVMRRMVRLAAGPRRKFRSKAPNTIDAAAPAGEACSPSSAGASPVEKSRASGSTMPRVNTQLRWPNAAAMTGNMQQGMQAWRPRRCAP